MNTSYKNNESKLERIFPLTKNGLHHKKDLNKIIRKYEVSEDFLQTYFDLGYITDTLAVARLQRISEEFLLKNKQHFEKIDFWWAAIYQEISAEFAINSSCPLEYVINKNNKMKASEKEILENYLKLSTMF